MRFHALLVVSLEIFVPQEELGEVTGLGDGRLCSSATSTFSLCRIILRNVLWSLGTGRVQDLCLNEEVRSSADLWRVASSAWASLVDYDGRPAERPLLQLQIPCAQAPTRHLSSSMRGNAL